MLYHQELMGLTTASLPPECHLIYAQMKAGRLPALWDMLTHKEQWTWVVKSYRNKNQLDKFSGHDHTLQELQIMLDLYFEEEKHFVYSQ
jgi:hypothetical protein